MVIRWCRYLFWFSQTVRSTIEWKIQINKRWLFFESTQPWSELSFTTNRCTKSIPLPHKKNVAVCKHSSTKNNNSSFTLQVVTQVSISMIDSFFPCLNHVEQLCIQHHRGWKQAIRERQIVFGKTPTTWSFSSILNMIFFFNLLTRRLIGAAFVLSPMFINVWSIRGSILRLSVRWWRMNR